MQMGQWIYGRKMSMTLFWMCLAEGLCSCVCFICGDLLGCWLFAEICSLAEAQLGKVARYLARSRGIKIPGQGYRTSQPSAMHSSGL